MWNINVPVIIHTTIVTENMNMNIVHTVAIVQQADAKAVLAVVMAAILAETTAVVAVLVVIVAQVADLAAAARLNAILGNIAVLEVLHTIVLAVTGLTTNTAQTAATIQLADAIAAPVAEAHRSVHMETINVKTVILTNVPQAHGN